MGGAWPQILIIKSLLISSVCLNAIAVDTITLESRQSAKQNAKIQLPINRSKRQGSRGYNDYWHYLIDRQAYFADELLTAHKPCGPYKPYDMHVLSPDGFTHHSSEDVYDPNVDIFQPDFVQPPMMYNDFVPPHLFPVPFGPNIHPRAKGERPMTYVTKSSPRRPNCNSSRSHSVTKSKLCHQNHRRPFIKGARNCIPPVQRCRKTKSDAAQCDLNAVQRISSQNATHIVIMHLGENNCICVHYIRKTTGVHDTDSDAKLEITTEEVLDDSTSIPVTTDSSPIASTEATITLAPETATSSMHIPVDAYTSSISTSDSPSSPRRSSSNGNELNRTFRYTPGPLSRTTISPSDENIILDSTPSSAQDFSSNKQTGRPAALPDQPVNYHTTPRTTSKEHIVLDSIYSTTVEPASSRTPDVGTLYSGDLASISKPSSSYKFTSTSEGTTITIKNSTSESLEKYSASRINTSSTENISSAYLDTSKMLTVPSTPSSIPSSSSTLSPINSTDSFSGQIASSTIYTTTTNTPSPVSKSTLKTTAIYGTTSTPSLRTTKYIISDLHSNSTASPTSTQNPKAAYSRSLVSTYSPPTDSTFSYSPSFYPKLIPAATTKTTLRPAYTTKYTLNSTYVAESAKTTPLPSVAMDSNYTTNSDSKSTSSTNTKNATFTSSSKLSTLSHRNTSFVSHSSVNSNSSLHTKSPLVSKDVKNSTVPEKGPLLSSLHKEEETHPGRHGSERTHVPMCDVQNTSKMPTELYTNRNKDGRENSSWMASKSSIEETLSVTKQENMASYFKEGRVISSVISHSAESVDNDLEPTTSFKKDLSSSGVIAKSQGSKTVGNKSENIRNNSEKDNSTSKHHDSKRIPPKLDDVSFVLSTELELNRASVKKERVVQSSDTFSSIISKVESSPPVLGHISNLKDKEPSNVKLTAKEGSRIDLNKGGRLENSSEKDHINSSNSNSQGPEPIPIKVDNVSNSFVDDLGTIFTLNANVSNTTVPSTQQGSTTVHNKDGTFVSSSKQVNTNSSHHDSGSNPIKLEDISNTFVLSREQNSNTTIVKNERAFASSSAISKADSSNDTLRDIFKEKLPSTTIPTIQQGPTPVHNEGGRFESSSEKNLTTIQSRPDDSEYTSGFVLSTDKDFSNTQLKNDRVVQSSFSSFSTTSKQYSAGDDLKSNSNVKDNTPGTSVLNTKQESRTIQNKGERLESSFEKDNSDGFGLIPNKFDEVSNSFVLPREHESNTARNKNERVVQSSIVSSSAISKSNTTDDDVRVISKLKHNVPSMILPSTKGGYRIIHNEDGRLESSPEKDNRNSRHDDRDDPIPIHDDDFLSAFVLSAEKEFSKGEIKNEKVVQPSFAKAHSTVDDFGGISKLTNSMPTPIAPATNQGSRTSHNKQQITVESSHTESIPIHVDDVSSAFVLSTEQETRKPQMKNERIVQSSFAPSSADSNDHDLKSISNFRDASTSTMVLNSKQESKTFHHKIEHLKNSTHRYNANLSHHDSEPISTKLNANLNTSALTTAKESSAAHTKTERIVQSSFASSSAISKTDSTITDFGPTSNLKDQGFRTVHNKDGRLVSTHSEAVPIHVDDVSGSFVLSREQESSKSQIENQRIVQSSIGSSSAISKADSTNHDLKSISYFMHDIPSTIVLSPNQGATIKYLYGGGLESSSKIDNSNSRHHVSEPIKFTVGNFSNSFMLSKPSAAHIQNKTVVQSSFASASAISKTDSTGYDLGPIIKDNDSQSKQGPTPVHDEGGRLENFSEKVNGKSRHHNSQTIPIYVDDVTHAFVLPTEQQSAADYAKNERVVHSSFASASAMSKADAPDDDLGSISNAKESLPSTIALLTNDGPRTIHNEGDKKNVNSGQDDPHATPIQVADVSHKLVISQEGEFAAAHAKNEKVVQSSFASASAVSKSHSTDDSLRPISNFKDSVPSTILLSPKQGPTTIHYEGGKLGYYFEKDKGSSRQNDSQTVPIYVDNVMHALELTTEPQYAAAHAKHERVVQTSFALASAMSKGDSSGDDLGPINQNERVVHSSFASASAVSKSPATDDGLRPMSKDKGSVPNTIVPPPKQGSTAIRYEAGRLEHFIEKDNGSTHHDSQTSPIHLDDVRRTFVVPTQQTFSETYAKNERVVQSSFASSSAISKADPTDDDLGHTSKDKDNPTSTIALSTKEDPTTFHKEDGKLDYVDYDKDNGNSGQEDSQTIPIHVYGVSVGESAEAHIKNERVVLSSFASASAISKSHSTDHDLEPIFKLKGDVPGSLDLSNEQGSRRVYNKVRSEEISSKTDNKNTRPDDPSSIPNKIGDYSRSYVLSTDQESMKAQNKNEKVVQSSFASNAAINKNEPINNNFKWIANFKKDIPNTSGLSQTAGNQHHQQFDRMDLLEELYNLERINQSSYFTTSPSTSSTRNSSTRTEMSNERNIDWPNVSSSKKYVEGQEIKMLQTGSKEKETFKDHRDNKFGGVSDRNSKDTESKGLKSNGMHPSVMDDISEAIDLGSSHHIFSYESSEGDTSRENYPIDNSNENESTQILTSTLVEKISESGNTADSSKVPPNSNGDLRALQFGSTAARTQNKNGENSHDTLKLDAGRSTANIKDKEKVPGRFSFRSFGIFKDNKANDRDSEEIDAEDVPENSSELSSECETSNESEAEILDTLRLETDKIGEKRNYVSGTGSRFMHVLRSPNERYPYYSSEATFAEPLVPGVYTTKRNEFKYKSLYPTTIYWRRIEPKTRICNSRLRELRPFEADDLEDGHASPEYYDIDLIDC